MMLVQKSLIEFLLTLLESTTGHICLAYSLNLLKSVLFAQLVKSIVNVVKPFAKLSTREHLDNTVKVSYVTEDNSNLSLIISNKSLTLSYTFSDKGRH